MNPLHIHDNDKWHDSHNKPFSMQIDFVPIIKALKDINYSGYLTLEADRFLALNGYDMRSEDIRAGVKELFISVNKLEEMMGVKDDNK